MERDFILCKILTFVDVNIFEVLFVPSSGAKAREDAYLIGAEFLIT